MRKALVVVDMQEGFFPSKKVQSTCRKQVEKAINNDMDIVFVEYYDFGPTVECLKEPIHNSKYEKVSTTIKGEWDGSLEVISEIDKLDHEISGVRFVGIYTDQCVHATVKGLQNRLPKTSIEVVAEACEAMDDEMHERGISSIKMLPNVKVV